MAPHKLAKLAGIAAIAVVVAIAPACKKAPDVQKHVDRALDQAKLRDVHVDWDADAKVAHLKGSVASPTDRVRAEEVAARVIGTSGMLVNEIRVAGTVVTQLANQDGEIREQLNALVQSDDRWTALRQRDINFEVTNGAVTITGEVANAREKARVGEIVRSLPGVRDVANALTVKPLKSVR